jgi:hypothetical protein
MKKDIKKLIEEAVVVVNKEDLENVIRKVGDDDNVTIKVIDEAKKINPWAICTKSVGRDDKDKYESCVKSIKKKYHIKEEVDENVKNDVKKLLDKLDSNTMKTIVERLNTPQEKAEAIVYFAEKIGVPKNKLTYIISSIKSLN